MSSADHPPPYPGPSGSTGLALVPPPLFIHECVPNCPAHVPKPGQAGYIPPAGPINVAPPPGYTPTPGQPQFPGHRPMPPPPVMPTIGPNGDPIFYHPHYPQLRADICKSCRHVVPIRPSKFAKKLTTEQLQEFMECFQVRPYIDRVPYFHQ